MARYMCTFTATPNNRNEVLKRFTSGTGVDPPEGASLVGRFIEIGAVQGWVVVETDDPTIIGDWVLGWNDIMDVTVTPVMGDEEAGPIFAKHGFGG